MPSTLTVPPDWCWTGSETSGRCWSSRRCRRAPCGLPSYAARVGSVAPKVLTQTLRALERDGVLTRTVYAQVPPRVEYQLTDLGHSLVTPIAAIQDWAESHVSQVLAARENYDMTIA